MEVYVRLLEELRRVVLEKVVNDSKEESEAVSIEAVVLGREIDDLCVQSYPISFSLRNRLDDAKDLCMIYQGEELIMKVRRRNAFWRTFISNWIDDHDLALDTVLSLRTRYWSSTYISNVRGIVESGDDSICFYVWNRFCSFSPLRILIK